MSRNLLSEFLAKPAVEELEPVTDVAFMQAMSDVDEAEKDAIEVDDAIEEMEEIEEGLESIVTSMEAALENGGLDPMAASFAHHAVGAYTGRFGMESLEVIPALESFGGDTGREASTQVSIEGIKETLTKIWNAIKSAVQKAIKAVSDLFAKIFGGADKVIAKLEAEIKKIEGLEKDKAVLKDKAELSVKYSESVRFGNSVTVKDIAKGVASLSKAIDAQIVDSAAAATKFFEISTKAIADAAKAKTAEEADKVVADLADGQGKTFTKIKQFTELMSGDKVIVTDIQKDETGLSTSASKLTDSPKTAAIKDTKVAPMSLAESKDLAKAAISILASVKKEKSSVEKISKAREEAIKASDAAVKATDDNVAYQFFAKAKGRSMLRLVQSDAGKLPRQLSTHGFSVARAVLANVEANSSLYEVPSK